LKSAFRYWMPKIRKRVIKEGPGALPEGQSEHFGKCCRTAAIVIALPVAGYEFSAQQYLMTELGQDVLADL